MQRAQTREEKYAKKQEMVEQMAKAQEQKSKMLAQKKKLAMQKVHTSEYNMQRRTDFWRLGVE